MRLAFVRKSKRKTYTVYINMQTRTCNLEGRPRLHLEEQVTVAAAGSGGGVDGEIWREKEIDR